MQSARIGKNVSSDKEAMFDRSLTVANNYRDEVDTDSNLAPSKKKWSKRLRQQPKTPDQMAVQKHLNRVYARVAAATFSSMNSVSLRKEPQQKSISKYHGIEGNKNQISLQDDENFNSDHQNNSQDQKDSIQGSMVSSSKLYIPMTEIDFGQKFKRNQFINQIGASYGGVYDMADNKNQNKLQQQSFQINHHRQDTTYQRPSTDAMRQFFQKNKLVSMGGQTTTN